MRPKQLSVSELRARLPSILHRTLLLGESFLIMKHGQPFAKLSPIRDKEELERVRSRLTQGEDDRVDAAEVVDTEAVT